jgi:hypothetical protein
MNKEKSKGENQNDNDRKNSRRKKTDGKLYQVTKVRHDRM